MTIDDDGNLFIAGTFSDKIKFGSTELISRGRNDVFIAKIILK